jgi:hypothetical protein
MSWLAKLRFRWQRWRWVRTWSGCTDVPEVLESEPWADDAPIGLHGIRDSRGYPLAGDCRLGCDCQAKFEARR